MNIEQLLSDFLEFATTGERKSLLFGSKRQKVVSMFLNCKHENAYLIGGRTSKCDDCKKIILPTGDAVLSK